MIRYIYTISSIITLTLSTAAMASPGVKTTFDGIYPNNVVSCYVCHTGNPGAFTTYGTQYVNAGGINGAGLSSAMIAIEGLDADGDGATNIQEINAGTDPIVNPNSAIPPADKATAGCLTNNTSIPFLILISILSSCLIYRKSKNKKVSTVK